MTTLDLSSSLGSHPLRSVLVAASGTVGSVVDFARTTDFSLYGAAVAKSVSADPWSGRPAPRLGPSGEGMLNGVGIQNPGVDEWVAQTGPRLPDLARDGVQVWGSAVGHHVGDFATVAAGLATTTVAAVEVNLSCPNLDGGPMFALDPGAAAEAVAAVVAVVDLPVGAKLSPNAPDVVAVAAAVAAAGASWVVLANTVWGAGIDVETRRPTLSGMVGGYSGAPVKAVALRCVWEVASALPGLPIVGCGGVRTGDDVVEFLLAGASAVSLGTVHFAEPRAAGRITAELERYCERHGVARIVDLIGAVEPW